MARAYEELVAAETAIRQTLGAGAEKQLRSIPGVEHVSVGLKETAGRVTDDHAIRVYVRRKRPDSAVSASERIPREIDGVRTDVIEWRRFRFTVDTARYRPVIGGIMIGNRIIGYNDARDGTDMIPGTLGCIATRTADSSIVLLSNWHVLYANGARDNDPVFQPTPTRIPPVDEADLPVRPTDDTDVIARLTRGNITGSYDAAIARLDLSSCCRCCGIDYRNEINGLSVGGHPPSNNILGQRAAVSGATVYKVGIGTGRRVGRVVETSSGDLEGTLDGTPYTLTGQIEIASEPGSTLRFSGDGDSGAALIDDDGYIVGLMFGSTPDAPPAHRAYANHIADVCTGMGITINITSGSTPTAGARPALDELFVPGDTGRELYAAARARVLGDPAGAWLWALGEEHRHEIVALVTSHRPVTVAWHRAKGPAFFADALRILRAGGEHLPMSREGITLETGLARMGDSLAAHGSAALRAALAVHRERLLASVRGSSTMTDVLVKLRDAAPAEITSDSRDTEDAVHG